MPFRHKLYFFLAAAHLLMVILFATHFTAWGKMDHPAAKAAAVVGHYTGSNNIFSFFAPGISDQPYVIYVTKDSSGKEKYLDLKGNSPEFANRVNNVYGYLTLPEARPVLSASLAQAVQQRYPEAEKIRVAMVIQQIPGMAAYRRGERNHWQFCFYRDYGMNTKK